MLCPEEEGIIFHNIDELCLTVRFPFASRASKSQQIARGCLKSSASGVISIVVSNVQKSGCLHHLNECRYVLVLVEDCLSYVVTVAANRHQSLRVVQS